MSTQTTLDERDPFVQLVFKSVVAALVLLLVAVVALEWLRPQLRAPLFVPIGAATFIGTLGFQAEAARKKYCMGMSWIAISILLFPVAGWLLLLLIRIPHGAVEAKFIPLIPQAVVAPALFMAIKKRFQSAAPPSGADIDVSD